MEIRFTHVIILRAISFLIFVNIAHIMFISVFSLNPHLEYNRSLSYLGVTFSA